MPPPPGGAKKKKKGRAPKHQNSFAFRHNPKSKKTDKILASPNVGVCRRCSEKIEWRKKYRKYKPRTQPGKCNLCSQKNILAAYHTICNTCAMSEKSIIAMEKNCGGASSASTVPAAPASALAALTLEKSQNPSSIDDLGDDEEERATEDTPSTPTNADRHGTAPAVAAPRRRLFRVCAICANAPARSKYADAGVDGDLVVKMQELEEMLESGQRPGEERRLTLREKKGMERRIERMELELRQRRTRRNNGEEVEMEEDSGEEGGDGDADGSDGGEEEEQGEDVAEGGDPEALLVAQGDATEDDPFLTATGGKALVGEDYQQMLLAREQQQ